MKTLSFQLWEIFFREDANIDERLDNIMWTVGAFLFLLFPVFIICIVGSFNGIWWLLVIGILLAVWSLCRFVIGVMTEFRDRNWKR